MEPAPRRGAVLQLPDDLWLSIFETAGTQSW